MRYYVVSDVHGFYDELISSLSDVGYFKDKEEHKLVVCGDLFDRGKKARDVQAFILNLLRSDDVILIRGNHEDLAKDLLNDWDKESYQSYHHQANGTVDTFLQLTESSPFALAFNPKSIKRRVLNTPFIKEIIPAMLDYYETDNYVFVHGWIPCYFQKGEYRYRDDWRDVDENAWKEARWINGIDAAHFGVIEKGKTIVCGHWHTSYGHAVYEGKGKEFADDADFSPYKSEGIIAIDACTAFSKKVNCVVIDD